MIYFIFLASLALATCYLACHWRNMTEFRLRKQLVHLSTHRLVHLPCYSVFYFPCLQATCSLVYLFTCPLYIVKRRKIRLQEEGFNLKSCFYSFVLVLLWWESLKILIRRLEKYKKRYIQ